LKIKEYVKPVSIEAANELCSKGAVVLGGGAFLNLGDKAIETAIDLCDLEMDFVVEDEKQVEIGAMATLRDIEKSAILQKNFCGILSKAAASIMGVQVRNIATIGGSVYGKYGFSDLLTVLLALDAEIELFNAGRMNLQSFLDREPEKDILLKIILKKNVSRASFTCMRKTETDFSVLNTAMAIVEGQLRLAVGARPGKARLAKGAMGYFSPADYSTKAAAALALLAAEELHFGSDIRASEEYRKELCKTMVKRCAMEVLA